MHKLDYFCWCYQAKLPLRLGGCGLRDSHRTAPAAYWASWADSISVICTRFPFLGPRIFHYLSNPDGDWELPCLRAVVDASSHLRNFGWGDQPSWPNLVLGERPPAPDDDRAAPGEWAHGWQFHASRVLEAYSFNLLLVRFALPSSRRNASSPNKARLFSARGPYAATWLTTCPCSIALEMPDDLFRCSMRYRLGIAVFFEGCDTHGHYNFARYE